jgi:octaprenyl-diphosphate synthase
MSIDAIRNLVNDDLSSVDQYIIAQMESTIPLINQIIEYVLSIGGKRVRPMVLLLAARALSPAPKQHIDLAAVIELIHTATLLHDDVVDSSTLRRGHETAHMIWGKNASVLVGDFLYSRAFQIVVDMHNEPVLTIFAAATHYIAEGEILQLINCKNPETTEAFYFDIIQRKTGKLFEIAAQLGAMLATPNPAHVEAMRQYGMHLGLAYQLIDDALDYAPSSKDTGKNIGQDLADGKTTLPLIHAMRELKGADLALVKEAIKTGSCDKLEKILELIESTGAIKYTADTAKKHAALAKEALSVIPESPYREALIRLSEFVVERNY